MRFLRLQSNDNTQVAERTSEWEIMMCTHAHVKCHLLRMNRFRQSQRPQQTINNQPYVSFWFFFVGYFKKINICMSTVTWKGFYFV